MDVIIPNKALIFEEEDAGTPSSALTASHQQDQAENADRKISSIDISEFTSIFLVMEYMQSDFKKMLEDVPKL